MTKPIIHIGLHKTGSSSLQLFVYFNKEKLETQGIYLPTAGWLNGAHHQLCYDILEIANWDAEKRSLTELRSEVSEGYIADLAPLLTSEEFERFNSDEVSELLNALGTNSANVIVYLRRQDEYILSDYAQQIKMGAELPDFDEYLENISRDLRFDYENTIQQWTDACGNGSVTAIVYAKPKEKNQFDLDFLRAMGLQDPEKIDWTFLDRQANSSWTYEETDFIRRVTSCVRSNYQTKHLDWAKAYAGFYPEIRRLCSASQSKLRITQNQFNKISSLYSASNKRLIQNVNLVGNADSLEFDQLPPLLESFSRIEDELVQQFSERFADKCDLPKSE